MGALQKIRSKSTLLVGVIAVGLLAFLIPWGEITQFLNMSKDKAFVIDGEIVKTRAYAERIEQKEKIEKLKLREGQQIGESQMAQIREEVYQAMMKEIILDDQADRLGLTVTDEELNDMVYGSNLSSVLRELPYVLDPQTGQVNREALNQFLIMINEDYSSDPMMKAQQDELQNMWSYIENKMRYSRLEEKYASLVSGSILVNDQEVKSYQDNSKVTSNLAFITQSYDILDDKSFEVSDAEIKDLYNSRKENFKSIYPSCDITYFVKKVAPSEADYEEVENQMNKIKSELETTTNPGLIVNQYSVSRFVDAHIALDGITSPEIVNFIKTSSVGDVYGPIREDRAYTMLKYVSKVVAPDSIQLRVLPIQSVDPSASAAIADSLMNVLKGGKDFATVAAESFPGMQGQGIGEAQWYNEVVLSSVGIVDECFDASTGSIIKVSINGMPNLIKIENKTKPVTKVKIAEVVVPVVVSDRTNNDIDNEINKFIAENKNTVDFEKSASNNGYNVISDAVVYPNNPTLDNIAGTREIIRWAFNDSKVDELKKFETPDVKVVAMVTAKNKEGYQSETNKDVKEVLKAEILKNKKADKLIEDIKSKNLTDLTALAESLNSKVDSVDYVTFETSEITGVGYEPVLNIIAKDSKVGEITSPLKGNRGVYVASVVSSEEEQSPITDSMIKNRILMGYSQILPYSAIYMLMNKMDIEDNRITFY